MPLFYEPPGLGAMARRWPAGGPGNVTLRKRTGYLPGRRDLHFGGSESGSTHPAFKFLVSRTVMSD